MARQRSEVKAINSTTTKMATTMTKANDDDDNNDVVDGDGDIVCQSTFVG